MSRVIRIDVDMFGRLVECIRHHQDPEDLRIELESESGDLLIYDNGMLCVTYGPHCCWVTPGQLCQDQRDMLNSVLIDQVGRIVMNIIEEACNVD